MLNLKTHIHSSLIGFLYLISSIHVYMNYSYWTKCHHKYSNNLCFIWNLCNAVHHMFQRILEHQNSRDLPLHLLRHSFVWVSSLPSHIFRHSHFFLLCLSEYTMLLQVIHQIRQWNWMALLLQAYWKQCEVEAGFVYHFHAPSRSCLRRLRCSSGPRLRRRTSPYRAALLYQQVWQWTSSTYGDFL